MSADVYISLKQLKTISNHRKVTLMKTNIISSILIKPWIISSLISMAFELIELSTLCNSPVFLIFIILYC